MGCIKEIQLDASAYKNLAGQTAEALTDYDLAEFKTKIILWLFRGQTRVLGIVSTGYYQAGGSVTEEEE